MSVRARLAISLILFLAVAAVSQAPIGGRGPLASSAPLQLAPFDLSVPPGIQPSQPPSLPVINYPTYSSWYAKADLTLTAHYQEQMGQTQLNWTWSWGDGRMTNTTGSAVAGTSTATHAWNAAGNYTVSVAVSDGLNPTTPSVPIYVNVSLDVTAPVTTITASGPRGNGAWYLGPVTLRLSASDTGSGVASTSYRFDEGLWQVYTTPFLVQAQGNQTVEYRSADRAGNVEPAETTWLSIDSLAPMLAINGPANGSEVPSSSVDLAWTASDSGSGVASVLISVDGGLPTPVTGSPVRLPLLPDGRHTVLLQATDAAGNMATTSVSFTVVPGILGVNVFVVAGIAVTASLVVGAVALVLVRRAARRLPPPPPG